MLALLRIEQRGGQNCAKKGKKKHGKRRPPIFQLGGSSTVYTDSDVGGSREAKHLQGMLISRCLIQCVKSANQTNEVIICYR